MDRRQRYGAFGAAAGVVIAVGAAVAVPRLGCGSEPPAPAEPAVPKVFPAAEPAPHPVIPPEGQQEQRAPEQPKAFCEKRDISLVGGQIRGAQQKSLAVAQRAPKEGAPASCHAETAAGELASALNALIGRTGACVARDSPLDSQWNQLESAVAALDRCMECTRGRAERVTGCTRVLELINAAEKATQ
jgi:hypothetical protein